MMETTAMLEILACAAIAVAVGAFAYALSAPPMLSAPRLGHRGEMRQQVLQKGGGFRLLEPVIRLIAGWISGWELAGCRDRIDRTITRSGDYLGITVDELIALNALSVLLFAGFGGWLSSMLDAGLVFSVVGLALGAALPWMQLQGEIGRRAKQINRQLPAAIDLMALCMGAGLDFPGALRAAADGRKRSTDAVSEEFARILQELEVGHTRTQALKAFEQRVPIEAVRDFVSAVVQAEEKGNPLADVLAIQAKVLRMHRSVTAEEAAARAGVLMIVPLFLLLCCILLPMLGPFIVNGVGF